MDGVAGLHRWQWLFLLLGIPVILLGLITFFFLENIPDTVHCKLYIINDASSRSHPEYSLSNKF